jgi:glutamate-1-semialdehyde 2,1-aminomutase
LRRLRDKTIYEKLETHSARLCEGLSQAATDAGITTTINRVSSMWTNFFAEAPITNWTTADKSDRQLYGRFFHAMLDEGIYLAPSQFEAAFVSIAHTEEIINQTINAATKAFRSVTEESRR